MSLQLVLGRAGTGKSKYCFQEIKKLEENKSKIYIITPEQFSYTQEKKLLHFLGKQATVNTEVITFNRMADRVLAETGGDIEKAVITKSSRAMLMYSILQENKDNLALLGRTRENLDLAINTITEFKKHNVGVKNIEDNISITNNKMLKLKLQDMQKIYNEYEKKMQDKYIDEDDKLTKLAKNIEKSSMFQRSFVYIDEFSGFTAQEYEIIRNIMKQAKAITITSCIDNINENEKRDIFYPNKQVIEKVIKIAKDEDIEIAEPIILNRTYRFKNDELKFLEENIYEDKFKIYNKRINNINLFLASNTYSEIEYIAKQIIKLVRDEDYKYNDISIITKNINNISGIVKAVFSKYGIPIYMDVKDELSQNISIKYILGILEIFSRNWTIDSVLDYIKLGFANIEKDEIFELENYVKKWGIKGNKWYKDNWNFEGNDEEINNIRKRIVEPLIEFKENLFEKKTARDISKEVYKFLNKNGFYEKVNRKIQALEQRGELKVANDYKLSIEALFEVIDEIVTLFDDNIITFERYKEILKIGLKYRNIGSIPQTMDEVVLGDTDRSKTHKVKAAFILGVNDGVFPTINRNEGFFNDNDREILKSSGMELAKGTKEMLYDEEFNIYKAMTIAEEKLFLSYSSSDSEGKSQRRAAVITRIKRIFPNLKEKSDVIKKITEISSKESTFEELLYNIKNNLIDEKWTKVYNWYSNSKEWKEKLQEALKGIKYTNKTENINKENIEKLYGNTLKTSISQLEKYKECAFSFHLKYGLKLKENEEFKIKTIDTGTFMHDIVDTFFESIKEQELKSLSKEDVERKVYSIINEKLEIKKNFIFTSTPKFVILTNRLKKVIAESIYYIVYQMQNSNFEVLGNEVEFSKKEGNVEIIGKVDRIDIAENEDGKFIRIIDYKSSSKNLDLNKMVTGLQIQLITYVDVMSEKTNSNPAGILYFNMIEPIVSKNKNLSDEEIEEEIRKAFKMKGLVLSDIKIIKMMDNKLETGASNSIPVVLEKSGDISKTRSSVLTKEEFTSLQNKIKSLIKQISDEILSGKIEIEPLYNEKQKKSACEYCPYKTICKFNPKENSYKYLINKSKDEIFKELNK